MWRWHYKDGKQCMEAHGCAVDDTSAYSSYRGQGSDGARKRSTWQCGHNIVELWRVLRTWATDRELCALRGRQCRVVSYWIAAADLPDYWRCVRCRRTDAEWPQLVLLLGHRDCGRMLRLSPHFKSRGGDAASAGQGLASTVQYGWLCCSLYFRTTPR